MVKKIFDILPPKEKESLFPSLKKEREKVSVQLILRKKIFLIFSLFLSLFLLFFVFSFHFSRAKIKIWPETEKITSQTEVKLDKDFENLDFENKILPARIFELEKNFSEEFLSTGKAKKYAQGKIRLYNSYTTKDEVWLKGTRFVSVEGKLFLSKDKIYVPGAKRENGRLSPSYVDVEVIAAEPGADFNIEPTKFSIVAFRGTPRYEKYYGESFLPMTGGGEVLKVTKDDLEKAEKELTERVKEKMIEFAKKEIPDEFSFSEKAFKVEIIEKIPQAKEGQELEKFTFQIKAKGILISFKKENLKDFAKKQLLNQVPPEKEIFKESLKIDYSFSDINFEAGEASLSLDFSAEIYPKINLNSLKETILGKSFSEVKTFLEEQPEILRIETLSSPFWVKKIPKEIERIEIEYPLLD